MDTGDKIEIQLATTGAHTKILLNDKPLPYVRRVNLEMNMKEPTVLTLEIIRLDLAKKPQPETYVGYFIEAKDCEAFLDWIKVRSKE